jgi:hypothetical protein
VSFSQVPDIAIELSRPGSLTSILLLDPKYKLESEDGAEPSDGTPKKVDVDKMHAYRDAIRDPSGRRAVAFAATLYPGKTVRYGADVAAIGAVPEAGEELQGRVGSIVSGWLSAAVA